MYHRSHGCQYLLRYYSKRCHRPTRLSACVLTPLIHPYSSASPQLEPVRHLCSLNTMHPNVHKLDILRQGGKVSDVSDVLKRPGASSDLLRGVLVNKDDVPFQVAIQRIRCSLEYDSHFEKVDFRNS